MSVGSWPALGSAAPPPPLTPKAKPMAKAQKRSNREVRKPKTNKDKAASPVGLVTASPVNDLMRKPKGKL